VNTNNGVKWRRFVVPKKFDQINDHLLTKSETLDENTVHHVNLTKRIKINEIIMKCSLSCEIAAVTQLPV